MSLARIIDRKFKDMVVRAGVSYKPDFKLENHLVDGLYGKSTIGNIAGSIIEEMIYQLESPLPFEQFGREYYELLEYIQNNEIMNYVEFISNTSMADMLEVDNDPRLRKAKQNLIDGPSPAKVNKVYDAVREIMFDPKINKHNYVAKSYVSAIASPKQQDQCWGTRGYPADLDGKIFTRCIVPSYFEGIDNVADMALESRGAVTALYFSGTAIQASETFSKKLQLTASIIKDLEYHDCGTTEGLPMYVRPSGVTNGEKHNGDLFYIKSMYYKMRQEDTEWKLITKDSDIEGKNIILRTALSCKSHDANNVCYKCYGKISLKMPVSFNLGNWAATQMTEQVNQSLLSTKHYIVSADGKVYILTEDELKLFILKNNSLFLNVGDMRKFKSIHMLVSEEEASGLKDLNSSAVLIPSRISALKNIILELVDKDDKKHVYTLNMNRTGGTAVFNNRFLNHIKNSEVEYDGTNYKINLKGWKKQAPFAFIPDAVYDYRKLASNIASCVESLKSPHGTKILTSGELLMTLHDVVNTKLSVHMSALATIAKSLSVVSMQELDLRVNQGVNSDVCTLYRRIRSSVATSWAVGDSKKAFALARDSEDSNTSDHRLNVLFRPKEIMEDERRKMRKRG